LPASEYNSLLAAAAELLSPHYDSDIHVRATTITVGEAACV